MIEKIFTTKPISPSFMIVGAQKAGTTALFHYLSAHSDIKAPKQKEIDFFWLDHLFEKGEKWYLEQFPKEDAFSLKRKISFEACPHYLFSSIAAQRISDFYPKMKIIILLRNPIERAFSQFQMYQRKRINIDKEKRATKNYGHKIQEFFEKLYAEPNYFTNFNEVIEQEWRAIQTGRKIVPYLLSQGFYAQQIKNYYRLFPKEQILILEDETLKFDTQNTLHEVTSFLNIKKKEWSDEELEKQHEGKYQEAIESKTRIKLQSVFKESNHELFRMIGKKFNW